MFDIGKRDIDDEYSDTLQRLKENKQKSFENFMKSPDYVSGVTNPGMSQINEAFDKQSAAAKRDYLNKVKKFRFSLQQRQAGAGHNQMFNNGDFR
tara:strand:- start:80 stop:364 length:285 start_codon:yes stop_codon:yes gene_type:complete